MLMNTTATLRLVGAVVLVTVLLAVPGTAQVAEPTSRAADASMTASKIHPVLRERLATESGPAKAWVFFTDKGITSDDELKAALTEVARTYSPRAIARRRLRGTPEMRAGQVFNLHDVPVVPDYVAAVAGTGAKVHITSRWLNAVSVWASPAQVEQLAGLACVDRLEAVRRAPGVKPIDVTELGSDPFVPGLRDPDLDYGLSAAQLTQINLLALHEAGYTGAGVLVGILDTGFARTHEAFNYPGHEVEIDAEFDFVDMDFYTSPQPGDPADQHDHGTLILGCLAAYNPGQLVGGAYDAAFVLCKTEDKTGEYPAEEDNFVAGLEFIEARGCDMSTASLGYIDWYTQDDLDGQTAVTTIAANLHTAAGVHHCNAAGNEYHDSDPSTSSLIAPADAFQVITCGAVNSSGDIAFFSSEGPTADGRVKPEVLARGISTHTVSAYSDDGYTTADGTSLSTPLVACAVACLTQAHPEWSPDEMRDAIFYTASDYVATGTYDPLYIRGYGIVNAFAPLQDCNGNGVPDVVELASGEATDCNQNSVLDECDIADGTSQDCNENELPDECDVAPPPPGLVDTANAIQGWVEISDSGTALGLSDDGAAAVTMPFSNLVFPSGVYISNNGGIGFSTSSDLDWTNQPLPSEAAFGGAQALLIFWDDIDADTGNVYYQTVGTAPERTFIVEWHNRPHFSGDGTLDGDEVTFQIQIFESPTDDIYAQFLYLDTDFDDAAFDHGASATVGYQVTAGEADQWSYNQAVITPDVVLSLQTQGQGSSPDENDNGIPDECELIPGDLNCDGVADFRDINPFTLALSNPEAYVTTYPGCFIINADCNGDGLVDLTDINPFVAILAGM